MIAYSNKLKIENMQMEKDYQLRIKNLEKEKEEYKLNKEQQEEAIKELAEEVIMLRNLVDKFLHHKK